MKHYSNSGVIFSTGFNINFNQKFWFSFMIVVIISVFIYFGIVRKHVDRRTRIGLRAGAVCGITYSYILVIALILGLDVTGKYFAWILFILMAVPGILIVTFGRDMICSSDDLVTSSIAAGITFSLLYVFNSVLPDILEGKDPFRNYNSGDFLMFFAYLVMIFLMVLALSAGSGSLFAEHLLGRPIPKEITDQFSVKLYCPYCQNKIEDWDVCPHCGRDLKKVVGYRDES